MKLKFADKGGSKANLVGITIGAKNGMKEDITANWL